MNIETVNELIQSLEIAGELSIKERRCLELAREFKQLAAENVALKAAIDATIGWQQSTDVENFESVRMLLDINTPATDRIVAGIKADGATAAGDCLKLNAQHIPVVERLMMQDAAEICYGTAARLREGAK
ncbi:hypothetical protein PFH69_000401 [Klebsiella oxytoca]|nr:hypothetical protein [Klebsiella oxytoca]